MIVAWSAIFHLNAAPSARVERHDGSLRQLFAGINDPATDAPQIRSRPAPGNPRGPGSTVLIRRGLVWLRDTITTSNSTPSHVDFRAQICHFFLSNSDV